MDKEKMLQEVFAKAKEGELTGGNCAQCSLAAILEVMGVNDENIIRAATGLADGVGDLRMGDPGFMAEGARPAGIEKVVFLINVRLDKGSAPDVRSVIDEFCRRRNRLDHRLEIQLPGRNQLFFLRNSASCKHNHK